MGQALTTRLNAILQEEGESFKCYFACFNTKLIDYEMISNEKTQEALWNGLIRDTLF